MKQGRVKLNPAWFVIYSGSSKIGERGEFFDQKHVPGQDRGLLQNESSGLVNADDIAGGIGMRIKKSFHSAQICSTDSL